MKNVTILIAALFAFAVPVISLAAEHGGHGAGHGGHQGDAAHEEVVDGVKATFKFMGMKEHMKAMNMELPKNIKETHHLSVEFKDVKTGKALVDGDVAVKLLNPDKTEQTKELVGMQGHFGADFDMSKGGKYGVMCKFKLKDGKVRQAKFWYPVKGAK